MRSQRPARPPEPRAEGVAWGTVYRLRMACFEGVYRLVRYRAWWVIFVSLMLSSFALYSILDLPIKESLLDLLPHDDPLIEQFKVRQTELQQSDQITLLLQLVDPPRTREQGAAQLAEWGAQISQRLNPAPEILSASHMLDPKLATLQRLTADEAAREAYVRAVDRLVADASDLFGLIGAGDFAAKYEELRTQFSAFSESGFDQSSVAVVMELYNYNELLIAALGKLQLEELAGFDPGAVRCPGPNGEAVAEASSSPLIRTLENVHCLSRLLEALERDLQTPVPDASPDGRSLRISIQPVQPSYVSLQFNKRALALVEDAVRAVLPETPRVRTYVAGSYSFTAESNQRLRLDMFYTTLISVVGIALIFLLTFRGIIYPLLVIIPLSMGSVWTTAWAKAVLGGFNLVTALLPALLLGLGINYGIHLIGRFVEERQRGQSTSRALRVAILNKGDAMLGGAITTAVVFFVMMLSRSQGLYEMGVVAGFGVLASALLTLFVLPALIVVSHLVLRRRLHGRVIGYRFSLAGAIRGLLRARWAVIAVVGLVTLGLVGPAGEVRVQFVSKELMASDLPAQRAREAIQNAGLAEAEAEGDFFLFFFPQGDEDRARALSEALCPSLLAADASGVPSEPCRVPFVLSIRSVENIFQQTSFLQSLDLGGSFEEGQSLIDSLLDNLSNKDVLENELRAVEDELRFWRDYAKNFGGQAKILELLTNLINQFVEIRQQLGRFNVVDLQSGLQQLQDTLHQLAEIAGRVLPNTIEEFLAAMPDELRSQFQTEGNEYIVYVEVSKDIYVGDAFQRFVDAVNPITTNYVGLPLIQHQLQIAMEQDFWMSTLGAFGLILVFLLVDFSPYRMLSAPLFVLLPLGLGYAWMLGGMGLLNISFNLTNMVISPLLIGIGVDNGIHLMHRYLERRNPDRRQQVQLATESVAMPILIANLTTMVAFGSLVFAGTPGLPVLGQSALLGVGSVAVCSLTLLPAVLARRR